MKLAEIKAVCLAAGLEETWPESISLSVVFEENDETRTEFGVEIVEDDSDDWDTKYFFPDKKEIDDLTFFWNRDDKNGSLFTVFGNEATPDSYVGDYFDGETFRFFRTPAELKAILKSL